MFDELMNRVFRERDSFTFKLLQCNDPYLLTHLLHDHIDDIRHLFSEAVQMVKELEELDEN